MPLIGIFRGVPRAVAMEAAATAAAAGISALEITMNSEEPLALLREMREAAPGITVGAGTVMSVREAEAALEAGAQFIVSPHLDEEIVRFCADARVAVFPGAMTPTEVWRAHQAGATMVKLFPAGTLGPDYIRALRGPFPQIDLLVTGGVNAGNVAAFLQAGAKGAAVGGKLFPPALRRGDAGDVRREAEQLVTACAPYSLSQVGTET
jgi:2-dehydro-3-deoxyphosphogluconate aldolase/(4S)-4-hydroxy-2-oxoglutarate aldolase